MTIAERTLDANGKVALRVTKNGSVSKGAHENEHTLDANGKPAIRLTCEDGSIAPASGGLEQVFHDESLSGTGTVASPLEISQDVLTEIETLRNNQASLGDSVSDINSKIPGDANESNQLATKNDLNTGLEGDYCCKYGIVDETKSELPYQGTGNQVIIPAQLVLDVPGVSGQTINASKITYDLTSTTNCELFLAQGTVIEATGVYWQKTEPEDGQTGYLAWWNGTEWKFKSNDTGNVWRTARAVRIAKCIFTDGSLTRLCFTGCRVANKQQYLPATPDAAGTYILKATVAADGKVTIGWVAE